MGEHVRHLNSWDKGQKRAGRPKEKLLYYSRAPHSPSSGRTLDPSRVPWGKSLRGGDWRNPICLVGCPSVLRRLREVSPSSREVVTFEVANHQQRHDLRVRPLYFFLNFEIDFS